MISKYKIQPEDLYINSARAAEWHNTLGEYIKMLNAWKGKAGNAECYLDEHLFQMCEEFEWYKNVKWNSAHKRDHVDIEY